MPSLSINSKDLDSLGINLKDLLKAIAQTKSSGDDVIKIKGMESEENDEFPSTKRIIWIGS